ncbi:MAG: MFS transporter [Gammaproteobacteria bacterium]|nr:MFS transporter [Gammaproteobacteria bacterium]
MFNHNMPKGVLNLNFVQLFSTVGFAVLLGTLNLYLQTKGMPIAEVNILTASFFALNFLLHFLGGSLGGSYFSYRNLLFCSLLLQIVGLLCLNSSEMHILLGGMACFLTGSGLNVSCINMMITQRFAADDMRRRTAFSINYSSMNLGFILGLLVANYFQASNNYGAIFIFAALCLSISLLLHVFAWKHVPDQDTFYITRLKQKASTPYLGFGIIILCFFITLFLMHHPDIGSTLVYVAFILGLLYVLYIAFKQPPAFRNKAIAYIIMIGAGLVYAFIQGLMSTALQNFVEYNTDKTFLGMHIEPSGFNSFESIGVVIFGFLLARAVRNRHAANKTPYQAGKLISSGLGFNVAAFLMIPLGIWFASLENTSTVPLFFPIILMFFVALAEVLVNAVNYSLAGEFIQPKYQGLFTGYLFLNVAVGNNLAGPFSNLILGQYNSLTNVPAAQTNPMYFKMFIFLAIAAAVITIIYMALSNWLNRLKTV